MALFKPKDTNFGGGIQASYHRVDQPSVLGKNQLQFSLVSFFIDPKETAIEPMLRCVVVCPYDMESSLNPFEQAYAYIKSLPEWGGSVGC